MRLFIVRHAAAGQFDPLGDDTARELTSAGRRRFAHLIALIEPSELAPRHIATSPLVRCRQTAELLAEQVGPTVTLNESAALAPGANLRELIAWSATKPHGEDLAWVGHAPDVSYLAAELLGTQGLGLQFRKGAILALDFSDHIERRHGRLSWFVWPKLLTKPE